MGQTDRLGVADADLDDDEVAALWAESGAHWLTAPVPEAPRRLVRRVVGLVAELDHRGAELSSIVPARGVGLLAERAAVMGLRRASIVSAGGATRFVRSADDWLAVSLARDEDRGMVPAWLGVEPDDLDDVEAIWTKVADATRSMSGDELLAQAGLVGLPCSAVDEPGTAFAAIAEPMGAADPRPLDDPVVVNLSALWAGPLCADVLARIGARLITVESTRRPDGGRLARRFFDSLHGRSESLALDLTTHDGRRQLSRLLARADVVIEGSRPRALEQMGIDAQALVAQDGGPQVWVSITAHGRSGDAGHRVGFGDDAAAAGGLIGRVGGEPRFVADAVADPLTGLTAARAVCDLLERGGRWLVDVALARTARSVRPDANGWAPQVDVEPRRPQPRSDPGAPMPLGRDIARLIDEFDLDGPDSPGAADLG